VLGLINQWLEKWRRPIWETIYRAEEPVSKRLVKEAYADWETWDTGADEKAAARLYLEFLDHQVEETYCPDPAAAAQLIRGAVDKLSRPVDTPLAMVMQARVLLTLRCWAQHQEVLDLPVEVAMRYLEEIPEDDFDHQLMSYLAFWAFIVSDQGILEKTYRFFLIQPLDFMVDYSRQRVKVMLGLVKETCESEDLVKLINLMPHPRHAQWVKQYVMPRCQELGLWSEDVDIHYKSRVTSLSLGRPQVPPRNRPEAFHVNF